MHTSAERHVAHQIVPIKPHPLIKTDSPTTTRTSSLGQAFKELLGPIPNSWEETLEACLRERLVPDFASSAVIR